MDQSRLGRSTREVPFALGKIFDSGIRVFTYLNDREIEGTTETDQFMLAAMAYVDGMQREQGRQRTHGCSATTTSRCSARPGSARTSSGVSGPRDHADLHDDPRRARPGADRQIVEHGGGPTSARAWRLGTVRSPRNGLSLALSRPDRLEQDAETFAQRHQGPTHPPGVRMAHARRARATDRPGRSVVSRASAARPDPARLCADRLRHNYGPPVTPRSRIPLPAERDGPVGSVRRLPDRDDAESRKAARSTNGSWQPSIAPSNNCAPTRKPSWIVAPRSNASCR